MHNPKTPRGNPETKGKRYTLTLRGVYVEHLDRMVDQGVYHESQDAIRQALRLLFEKHGVELYLQKSATSP
ncbi:unnamed protein product [marine sediment metagenome]|uniref:Ribbon-helix-helix protein CopG domain-containing protein n=1 Tax=marine sediment metagenome TaxID=412755 RepID=X1UVF8_9ZZZZ